MSSPTLQENSASSSNQLIKKCSLFDFKNSKELIDIITDVIESSYEDSSFQSKNTKEKNAEIQNLNASLIENLSLNDKISCTTCLCTFNDRVDQIEHFKGDLHLFNLKQKLKSRQIVSADEFEKLSDISSISGSDTENEQEQISSESESEQSDEETKEKNISLKSRPKVFFKLNNSSVLSMFRCVLHGKKDSPESQNELINKIKSIKIDDHWCIILVAAGHFAAAVFKGDQVIVHKTFHRYVVRAKRGGVQSQHDNTGKHAKSAGANIRRHQEAAFKDEIKLLIGSEWKSEIDKCKCVFIRVPQYNRSVLISTNNQAPFDKNDFRLRNIPFMTFRPTFNEVKRTHNLLSRIENYNSSYIDTLTKYDKKLNEVSQVQKTKSDKSKSKKKSKKKELNESKKEGDQVDEIEELDLSVKLVDEKKSEELNNKNKKLTNNQDEFILSLSGENLKLFNEIYTSCVTNNVIKLKQLLNTQSEDKMEIENHSFLIEKLLNKRLNRQNGFTLLHLCSQMGHNDCVWELLLHGADPNIQDLSKQKILPYFISANKTIRDIYRRFMNDYPNRYDYISAKISDPISVERMNEKLEKEKEKKRLKRAAKKERDAQLKEKEKLIEIEENERRLFSSLTDQEKRLLIVDRNFLNIMPTNDKNDLDRITQAKYSPDKIRIISRCWYCGIDMSSSVPFEYCDYKFCTTKCLKSHRTQQQELQKQKILNKK